MIQSVSKGIARQLITGDDIKRARIGLYPYRRPRRGNPGYWWRRRWLKTNPRIHVAWEMRLSDNWF